MLHIKRSDQHGIGQSSGRITGFLSVVIADQQDIDNVIIGIYTDAGKINFGKGCIIISLNNI